MCICTSYCFVTVISLNLSRFIHCLQPCWQPQLWYEQEPIQSHKKTQQTKGFKLLKGFIYEHVGFSYMIPIKIYQHNTH